MTNTYHSDIVNNDIAKTTLSNNNETNWTWSFAQYVTQIVSTTSMYSVVWNFPSSRLSISLPYSEGYALEDKDYMWPNAATGTMRNSGAKVGYRLASFFGKVNYNWDDLLWLPFYPS